MISGEVQISPSMWSGNDRVFIFQNTGDMKFSCKLIRSINQPCLDKGNGIPRVRRLISPRCGVITSSVCAKSKTLVSSAMIFNASASRTTGTDAFCSTVLTICVLHPRFRFPVHTQSHLPISLLLKVLKHLIFQGDK